ncbi:MAG: hypothetical protein ACTSP3_05855 [Candidatus Heimdallarchaeaceae archaeon]
MKRRKNRKKERGKKKELEEFLHHFQGLMKISRKSSSTDNSPTILMISLLPLSLKNAVNWNMHKRMNRFFFRDNKSLLFASTRRRFLTVLLNALNF